ncbi:PstS family phosphate ABC transporter substrate-binding protein [Bacteroidota bacterium]
MKTTITFLLAILIIINSGCKNQNENTNTDKLKGYISISGAFALYPITVLWADEFQKIYSEVKIDISAGGAGKGMTDALSKTVDLGMFSREVSQQELEKGAWYIALTKDAVLPTINASNPYINDLKTIGITKTKLIDLYVNGKITYWEEIFGISGNNKIKIFTRSDACGAAAMWAQYLNTTQEELLGLGVFADPGVADAVKNDKYSIGYNNVVYIYDINTRNKYKNLEVLPIDLNENGKIDPVENFYSSIDSVMKAIKENIYPSPPARDLYFVSQGKPEKKEVLKFIEWILTEGQKYVSEAGYVQFSEEKIKSELKKIQ